MPGLTDRPAEPSDIAYLTQLRLRTIHTHLRNAGSDLSFEEHELRASTRLACCSILSIAPHTVGMIKIVRTTDSWTIEQLQIEPQFQGRGVGAAVVRRVQHEAQAAGVPLLLSVLSANPARRLYGRLGFVELGEADGVVQMQSAA